MRQASEFVLSSLKIILRISVLCSRVLNVKSWENPRRKAEIKMGKLSHGRKNM
jgi:hypothetical protein